MKIIKTNLFIGVIAELLLNFEFYRTTINDFINGNVSFDHKFKKEGHQLSFTASGEYTEGYEDAVISSMEIIPLSQTLNQDVTKNERKLVDMFYQQIIHCL